MEQFRPSLFASLEIILKLDHQIKKLSLISTFVGIKAATFPLKEAKTPSGREGSVEWDLYTVS